MVNLQVQQISKEIDYFGSTITLRSVTDASYSAWGDPTETTSDTASIKSMVQTLTQEDQLVKEGIFLPGDIIFWFKGNRTDIIRGYRIQYNSKWYEIVDVLEHDVADTTYVIEARTKKV
jgi:head-tail adaptor